MPSFGICSRRKTSVHFAEAARAIAQPTTPPPMITMLARSMLMSGQAQVPAIGLFRDAALSNLHLLLGIAV
jgi:hypothetical protein